MKPREKTPHLELSLINDTSWSLKKQEADKYTLILFYRGYHCPVCRKQLEEVKENLSRIIERGIHVIAISMDSEEKSKKTGKEWAVEELPIGYGLSKEQAKEWGLYLSTGINEKEPELFSEPGMFLIKADQTLYFSSVQTMPFTRPKLDDVIQAIDYIENKQYPARGEV
ncbi:AhpC/TSA family protein [Nonlabens sp. Ci31]|jgi:peroxiredoxin|uniref:peroxiredoxin-like family protein n=1 Tax=Nonlabens sp. Ci31 TaxID=2608253 RepID=UPI001463B5E8|nr:peroxiredoxin-like family protein [Nonlabens sp. Ci31]QJP33528.1 AhpC/TSA family protein [Nonlabens sp. Ci31]